MTVYVDKARHPFGRMIMCHMIADTLSELHAMADRIGVARRWCQLSGSFPHYDISLEKRAAALRCGAVEIERRDLAATMKRLRADPAFMAAWKAAYEAAAGRGE